MLQTLVGIQKRSRLERFMGKSRGIFSTYDKDYGDVKDCDCSCCIAQKRMPHEVSL